MPLSINTNLMAGDAARTLGTHYNRLSTSVQRLASGLRINSAADDAAGLAIRELMRAEVASLNQGVRNANDAISMIQVADGALAVIDEKLIRMKELAEQAATGTYNSTQRLMIHSEFQAMACEIDRIANATDFNGIKLLDGSLTGSHNGSGLTSTGAMKIHFGTGNDSAEDYYYVEIGNCTLAGLGLREEAEAEAAQNAGKTRENTPTALNLLANNARADPDPYGGVPILSDVVTQGQNELLDRGPTKHTFSCLIIGIIPAGTTDFSLWMRDSGRNDTFQIFNRTGQHIAGTTLDKWTESPTPNINPTDFMTITNGFLPSSTYDDSLLNGIGNNLTVDYTNLNPPLQQFIINGMKIGYTGDGGDQYWPDPEIRTEELTIDNVTEDLILIIAGYDNLQFKADWTYMPTAGTLPDPPDPPNPPGPGPAPAPAPPQGEILSIKTQDEAQQALGRIDDAIVTKDKVRAHLGALQNRLENTITNLSIQAENLQAAESRISDVDVATEMTQFVRNQILTQSAIAMLGQANSFPHMLLELLER